MGEPRAPWNAEPLQERGLCRVAVRHAGSEESIQMLQEMAAEDVTCTVGVRDAVGAHYVDEIGVGIGRILAIADPRHGPQGWTPYALAQGHQPAFEPRILCRDRLAGAGLPEIEGGHRQDAIGLRAATQGRERPEAT